MHVARAHLHFGWQNEGIPHCFVHAYWVCDADAIARLLSVQLYGVCQPTGSVRMRECN